MMRATPLPPEHHHYSGKVLLRLHLLIFIRECIYGGMCVKARVWMSEDDLWVSILSFHHVSPERSNLGHQSWQQVPSSSGLSHWPSLFLFRGSHAGQADFKFSIQAGLELLISRLYRALGLQVFTVTLALVYVVLQLEPRAPYRLGKHANR